MRTTDEIRAELRGIASEYARLWALYGGGDRGMWDHDRRALLSVLEREIRLDYKPEMKISEARVNSEAHAHPRYLQELDTCRAGREIFAAIEMRRDLLIGELKVAEARESFGVVEV